MSDAVIVAIVAALPATLGAALGLINRITINHVHTAVNGERSEMKAQLRSALTELEVLKRTVEASRGGRRKK